MISEIVANCNNLVDNQTLNLSDIDLEFVATNAGNKNNPRNPERQLVRYQLMEYFVRIAKTKFVKNKVCENIVQATEKIYDGKNPKNYKLKMTLFSYRALERVL